MSASLSIPGVPPNERVPLTYFSFSNANAGQTQTNQRTLLIGTSNYSVASALVPITSPAQAQAMFGPQSPLAAAIIAYLNNDPLGTLYALPYMPASGATAATGSIAITGTATAAGTLSLFVGGVLVPVNVNLGDTATTVATNTAAAINAGINLMVSATSASGVVTVTAETMGLSAGAIDLRLNYGGPANGQVLPSGLTVTITQMTGGTSNPSLTTLAGVVGDQNFDFIYCEYNDTANQGFLSALENNSSGRWSPGSGVFGHVFGANVNTYANLLTFGGTVNDAHRTYWGVYDTPTPAFVWGAAHTGTAAVSLRADPARPLQTLQVQGVLAPPLTSQFNRLSNNALLNTGVALSSFDQGGNVYILRAVTTYQTNSYGQPDQSYLDVETLFSLMLFIRTINAVINTKFGRMKLADNGTRFGFGQAIVTPSIIANEIIAQYNLMVSSGLVEDADSFAAGLIVVRNASDASRVDCLLDPYLVSGLRIFAALTQFYLNSSAFAV